MTKEYIEQVSCYFAHPDDESITCGGTLRMLCESRIRAQLTCFTRGENGTSHGGPSREQELQQAASELGIPSSQFLDYRDGFLPWEDKAKASSLVLKSLLGSNSSVVITFGPEGLYWHPDHVAVHEIVTAAVEELNRAGAEIKLYYATMPEGHVVEMVEAARERGLELQAWGIDPKAFGAPRESITTVVDVRRFLPQKLAALRAHRSQFGPDNVFTNLPDDLAEKFLGYEYFTRAGGPHRGPDPLLEFLK